jgi:hypothetical protein
MNLDNSLIRISALIIKMVKKARIIKCNELLDKLINSEGENVRYTFVSALNFVFLFGLIEYYPKTDSLAFIPVKSEKNEN